MTPRHRFRLGDVALVLDTHDADLRERFLLLWGESVAPYDPAVHEIELTTRLNGPEVRVTFDGAPAIDLASFLRAVFPERGHEAITSSDGARVRIPLGDGAEATGPADGTMLEAAANSAWRPFVANLGISRAISAQQGTLFFHAASVRVGQGALLACGPKRSGKTTLATSLGLRGHGVYGDELAAIRIAGGELLPVRRSLAIRDGPAATGARAALERLRAPSETFPDGESRARASVAALLGVGAPASQPLTAVFLLRSFSKAPIAQLVPSSAEIVAAMTPLGASLWGRAAGRVLIDLLRLLAPTRIFLLDSGPPDDTAALVEQLMETA